MSELEARPLQAPMVFITGARQVGKTHLARQLAATYYNWDTAEVRAALAADPYFFRSGAALVVFDELHKRRDWRRLLKGWYDSPERREGFVVTGSGRLDHYQRGGDSLQGRYDAFTLWPLTLDEVQGGALGSAPRLPPAPPRAWAAWEPDSNARAGDDEQLLRLGGFPAPFVDGREARLRRWLDQYLDRLVRQDVRDFSQVQRLDQLDLLARLLPERVGAPLSASSLAEDLDVSHVTVRSWMRLLETLYLGLLVRPYHRKIARAVKREPKWYFLQWAYVPEPGPRHENYLAMQLAAACSAWSEQGHGRWELFYLRDQDRREVDFLIARDLKPVALIEAKLSANEAPPSLAHFCKRLAVPGFVVTAAGPVRRLAGVGWSVPSAVFLRGLIAI